MKKMVAKKKTTTIKNNKKETSSASTKKKVDKISLFEELANIDKDGVSREVSVGEFVGKYASLTLGNGGSWCREDGPFGKKYRIVKQYGKSPKGARCITSIRTTGFNKQEQFSQSIKADIRKELRDKKCVVLGVKGKGNLLIEIDHKDGRKNDMRVSNKATQNISDFQPLTKVCNDLKRNICNECAKTNKRWDATQIEGLPYPFYAGDENYTPELGCIGCYLYDPVEYRKESYKRYYEEMLLKKQGTSSLSKDTFQKVYETVCKAVGNSLIKTLYSKGEDDNE